LFPSNRCLGEWKTGRLFSFYSGPAISNSKAHVIFSDRGWQYFWTDLWKLDPRLWLPTLYCIVPSKLWHIMEKLTVGNRSCQTYQGHCKWKLHARQRCGGEGGCLRELTEVCLEGGRELPAGSVSAALEAMPASTASVPCSSFMPASSFTCFLAGPSSACAHESLLYPTPTKQPSSPTGSSQQGPLHMLPDVAKNRLSKIFQALHRCLLSSVQ
jgi:hypothetical protein